MSKSNLSASLKQTQSVQVPTRNRPERLGKKGLVAYIDPALHDELKIQGIRDKMTLQQIAEEALRSWLASRQRN